jgi:hypothetical protein
MMSSYEMMTFCGMRWEALASVGWGRTEQLRIQPGMGTRTLESVYIYIGIIRVCMLMHIHVVENSSYIEDLGGNSTTLAKFRVPLHRM